MSRNNDKQTVEAAERSFDKRKEDEAKEGYSSVKTDLPESRFQSTKQVLTPNEMGVTPSSIPGTADHVTASDLGKQAATRVKSKMKIRPDVSVSELKGVQVGGVPLASIPSTRSVAGVSSMSPADDTSKIPYSEGKYRPDTRYGKKRSEDLFILDNTISEQIVPEVDDSLDLREAPEAKQGYNGRKQFKQTRGKKNFTYINGSGHVVNKVPQQLLNDASLDFITTSKVVYTSGQIVKDENGNIDSQADYPTQGADYDIYDEMHKSNYKPKSIVITTDGTYITGISINEDVYEVTADPVSRDQSNMNWQVDGNNVAKSMIRLQTELGRETTDKWSPLGYVIRQPYQYNMLAHDIEASTGAIMALAYRSAVSSMAFQRNIAAKDGVNPQLNAIKMITEGYAGVMADSTPGRYASSDFQDVIFNQGAYKRGSVAALIDMFDSNRKYKTKADILGLQRGLSLHLSQCDNNLGPLHVKPSFMKALDKAHMFSTIDGGYNPMLPIWSTRLINPILPCSLNVFLKGWKNPHRLSDWTADDYNNPLRDKDTGTLTQYSYKYSDLRNYYETRVQHPIVEGLIRWLLKHEGAFVNTYGVRTKDDPIVIPFEFNFMAPSMLSFLLCSASQDVLWERNIIYRDWLFAGEQSTYVWDDLKSLNELNPLFSSQLMIKRYDEPLSLGKLSPDTAIRELWSGHMQKVATDSSSVQYFAPWYMNEVSFKTVAGGRYTAKEGFFNEPSAFNMSIPSIRDGVRHEYVDLVKGMDERDVRLALDRYVTIPIFDAESTQSSTLDGSLLFTVHSSDRSSTTLNDNVKISTLRYDPNSDGRLVLKYDVTNGSNRNLTHHALYLVPKELGFIDDEFSDFDVITQIGVDTKGVTELQSTSTHNEIGLGLSGSSAFVYCSNTPLYLTSYRVNADSSSDGSIDRSAALTQVFFNFFGSTALNDVNLNFISKIGIYPALSYANGVAQDLKGVYSVGSNIESTNAIDITIRTNAARMWSLIQRFFLPVNRFENSFTVKGVTYDYDPFESSFFFGLCGFLASDYTQDVLERLDVYDQLGLDYTEDVFVKDSLLFR